MLSAAITTCADDPPPERRDPALTLDLVYPVTRSGVCNGRASALISFDLDGDDAWEWRFLVNSAGTLAYGCGRDAAPCDGPLVIDEDIPVPKRVMVEGLTVTPEEYAHVRHDVVCRGIADSISGMGSITVTDPDGPEETIEIRVPMLRPGYFNGVFSDVGPTAYYINAASVFDQEVTPPEDRIRAPGGGVIVVAGGYDLASDEDVEEAFEFHPWSLSFTTAANLAAAHYVGTAVSTVDTQGNPAVMFAGGYANDDGAVVANFAEIYRPGIGVTATYPLLLGRTFQDAATHRGVGTRGAVLLMAGCAAGYTDSSEIFRPDGCNGVGAPGFCAVSTSTAELITPARCEAAGVAMSATRAWIGGGNVSPAETTGSTWMYDGAAGDWIELAPVPTARKLMAAARLDDTHVAFFGGAENQDLSGQLSEWGISGPDGTMVVGSMNEQRVWPTAVTLVDGSVLVSGGLRGGGQLDSAEILRRAPGSLSGAFELIPPPGKSTCTPNVDCSEMRANRMTHAMVRIDGSDTWIEGSVLVVGGGAASEKAELFVPAWECDGDDPVNPVDGSPVPVSEFCDRRRDPQGLTDPRKP